MTLTSTQMTEGLRTVFGHSPVLHVVDGSYDTIADAKAATFFHEIASQAQKFFGGWKLNARDCDKYARFVAAVALMAHTVSGRPTGISVGVLSYNTDAGVRHAVNIIVTGYKKQAPGHMSVSFRVFEPQTGNELKLSVFELKSVNWIMI